MVLVETIKEGKLQVVMKMTVHADDDRGDDAEWW